MTGFVYFVTKVLDDDFGISEGTYNALLDVMCTLENEEKRQLSEILKYVEATKGRFYLSQEGHISLLTLGG